MIVDLGNVPQWITALAAVGALLITLFTNRAVKKVQKQTDGVMHLVAEGQKALGNIQGHAEERADAGIIGTKI